MSSITLNILQLEEIDVTSIVTSNGEFRVFESEEQTNDPSAKHNAIDIVLEFAEVDPGEAQASPGYRIGMVLESKIAEIDLLELNPPEPVWTPIARLYDPFSRESQGLLHQLNVGPQIQNEFAGVPLDIFDGSKVVSRISDWSKHFPTKDWRIAFVVEETKYGTSDALQSFTVNLLATKYNGYE